MKTGDINLSLGSGNFPQVLWNADLDMERLGAEWYLDRHNTTLAVVTNYRQTLYVRTAGNLRIRVIQHDGTPLVSITTTAQLNDWGISSDEQLDDAIQGTRKKGRFLYEENPYFEVVRYDDNSVAFTTHNLFEAVQMAFDTITKGYAG